MSKKLIAVASAAALALSALVALPAAAAAPSIAITGVTGGGAGTSSSNVVVRVPDANSIASAVNAAVFTVSNLETGDVLRITTSGAVKAIDTAADVPNSSIIDVTTTHKSSIEKTRTGNANYVFYVQTTSTTAGTVVVAVTRTGLTSTNTYYVKGSAGAEYKITDVVGVPTTMAKLATAAVTFKVTDIFGNAVETTVPAGLTKSSNLGTVTWDSSAKNFKSTLTAASSSAFTVELDLGATDVDGFADATDSYVNVVNFAGNASLATQVASLISDYNALAKKWNKLVASKKAPKKKVALK